MSCAPFAERISFEDRIDQLKDFKEKHGHLCVVASLDKPLAYFCTDMRFVRRNNLMKSRLVEERMQALDDIGFDWDPPLGCRPRTSFEKRIDQLKYFKEKHGHLFVTAT